MIDVIYLSELEMRCSRVRKGGMSMIVSINEIDPADLHC